MYILTNNMNNVLYVGVTSDLVSRILEHKSKTHLNGFTSRYNVDKLIYFEGFHSIEEAIAREKQLKSGSRQKKIDLVDSMNPSWIDLYEQIAGG